jgi:uncharacterized protein YcnI
MFPATIFTRFVAVLFVIGTAVTAAFAHVSVLPRESAVGASQTYTMLVPTERNIATVRIEAEFPAALDISSFEEKPGWKIEAKRDPSGKILGAIWSGSSIAPREVAEFHFLARNPTEEVKLAWKVVQVYEDGSRSEWTGAEGSRSPAPVTLVKRTATVK